MRRVVVRLLVGAVPMITASACLSYHPHPVALPRPGTTAWWGGPGVGGSSAGLHAQAELSRYANERLVRARYGGHSNTAGGWQMVDEPLSVIEFSILSGRGAPCCGGNWGAWALGGGVVTGSKGYAPTRQFTTVGLAAEAILVSARAPHLSASVFGNVNAEAPFAGVGLSLVFGRMPFVPNRADILR